MEFYDIMVQIWGGAPATEPLPFGVQSTEQSNNQIEDELDSDAELERSLLEDEATTRNSEEVNFDDGNAPVTGNTNRKRTSNIVPTLIHNKHRHMENQDQCKR